jgi:glutamate 5-kinase
MLGKGEVYYSSDQLHKIMGKRSCDAEKVVAMETIEVIHRDKWVRFNI